MERFAPYPQAGIPLQGTRPGRPEDAVQLVAVADRKAVGSFLKMSDLIDLAIPRGGLGLIERVCRDATMPVLKHFSGNCHVYVDAAAERFTTRVDTGVAMVNVSTRFNDGGELGFGAELGISTDKLHARGPCGIKELTTYKYVVTGTGQIRS